MTETSNNKRLDWAGSMRGYAIAWGVPSFVIVAGSLVNAPERTVIWSLALLWMGSACWINARRCGRMHCRYTAPFYLLLIVPVALHGSGLVSFGPYAWWIMGACILFGGKVIWWATEKAWGKYVS